MKLFNLFIFSKSWSIALMLFFTSVSIVGQVMTTNPNNLQIVGEDLNLTPVIIINRCEPPNPYPCAFEPNTVCVTDEDNQYSCECIEGYTRGDDGVCKSLCHDRTCLDSSAVCNEEIVEGKAICLNDKGHEIGIEKGGVVLCDTVDLGGNCYLYRKNITIDQLGFYPKSAKPIGYWEFYLPLSYDNKFKYDNLLYSNDDIINLSIPDYSSIDSDDIEWKRKEFIIQTDSYEGFSDFHGDTTPYVEILYMDGYPIDGEYVFKFREVLSSGTYQNNKAFGPTVKRITTHHSKMFLLPSFIDMRSLNLDDTSVELGDFIITNDDTDLSEGLVVCKEADCAKFDYHSYYLDSNHYSYNWPVDSSKNIELLFEEADTIYLHEGWEALACPKHNSLLSECIKINSNITYDRWNQVTSDGETWFLPKLLIVQPNNKERLESISGGKYSILYSEPNYSGNSIAYWKIDKRFPNPIKQVRSIYSKFTNTYLSKDQINKTTLGVKPESIHSITHRDNFLHTTDSTSWKFDLKTDNNSRYWNSIILKPNNKRIEYEGVKIKLNVGGVECESFLQGRIDSYKVIVGEETGCPYTRRLREIKESEIILPEGVEVQDDWEMYLCDDDDNCKYNYSTTTCDNNNNCEYNHDVTIISYFNDKGNIIKNMLIQPRSHQKMNQFYGHKEYNEQDGINALEGYVILYRNPDYKDCIKYPISAFVDCGQKEIVLGKSNTKIKTGVDTVIKPDEIKAIRSVGSIDVEYENTESDHFLLNKKYSADTKLLNLIIFNKPKPTVTLIKSLSPASSFGKNMLSSKPSNSNQLALRGSSGPTSYNLLTRNEYSINDLDESINQNRDMDNGDLLIIDGHGSWSLNTGSSQVVFGGHTAFTTDPYDSDKRLFRHNYSYGGQSLGDYETDWLIIPACNSLGESEVCSECTYSNRDSVVIHNYGVENCIDDEVICNEYDSNGDCSKCELNDRDYTDYTVCNELNYKYCEANDMQDTNEKEVFNAYMNHFKNGLHGIGGMFKLSFWPCSAGDSLGKLTGVYIDSCGDLADDFWAYIKKKKSIAFSYLVALGSEGYLSPGRNAGYIAPGSCKKNDVVDSYVHDDHYHGYGNTLMDPTPKFIKENGFCYTSYWSHCEYHIVDVDISWDGIDVDFNYYTCSSGRHKNFSSITPRGDWDILIGSPMNNEVVNSLSTYFNSSNNINESGQNGVTYLADDFGSEYIEIDGDDSKYGFSVDQKLVDNYFQEVQVFYNTVFEPLVRDSNLQLLSVTTSFVSSRHYDSEGNKDSKVFLSEIVFNLELGYKDYLFFDNNNIKIGINTLTGDITFVKSKLISLEKSKEIIKKTEIDNYINSLSKSETENYFKSYIWSKSGELRPIVFSVNYKTADIKILKTF